VSAKAQIAPAPGDLSDVEAFDSTFRWWVRSRTNPKKRYLCDLSSYKNNGTCSCEDFKKRFEKFLTRGHDATAAFEAGQVQLRDYMIGVDDALRCWHLCRAQKKLTLCLSEAIQAAAKAQAPAERR
jgi:hypothetical protein